MIFEAGAKSCFKIFRLIGTWLSSIRITLSVFATAINCVEERTANRPMESEPIEKIPQKLD